MIEFTYYECKQIAALKTHPGFILLVDSIKAQLDDLTEQLREVGRDDEPRILAKWRVFTDIYTQLVQKPEEFALEVFNHEQAPERAAEMPAREYQHPMEISKEAEKLLLAAYEAKKNKLK